MTWCFAVDPLAVHRGINYYHMSWPSTGHDWCLTINHWVQ